MMIDFRRNPRAVQFLEKGACKSKVFLPPAKENLSIPVNIFILIYINVYVRLFSASHDEHTYIGCVGRNKKIFLVSDKTFV